MSQPIRVLHILQRMEFAGVQTLLMNIYRNIDRSKVQFDFLVHYSTPQFFDDEISELGGRIYRFSVREDYNFIKYIAQLNAFFKEHPEYKIVHGHMHSLGAFYLNAARKYGVPVRIAHSHTNSTQNDIKKHLKLFMNRRYAKYATDLLACSNDAGHYMFEDKSFKVINNAINAKYFQFSKEKREAKRKELAIQEQFVLGNVGRFTLQKNQKFSVDVLEGVLKWREDALLLLIGTGPLENEVKEYVQSKRLDGKVIFLGNRSDMAELYMAMDVFLFPSLFEGLGIVGVEAQAAGTPTICTETLPEEISVSPLLHRIALDNYDRWVECVLEIADNQNENKDMTEYIKAANYEIKETAKWLMQFYIQKHSDAVNI